MSDDFEDRLEALIDQQRKLREKTQAEQNPAWRAYLPYLTGAAGAHALNKFYQMMQQRQQLQPFQPQRGRYPVPYVAPEAFVNPLEEALVAPPLRGGKIKKRKTSYSARPINRYKKHSKGS